MNSSSRLTCVLMVSRDEGARYDVTTQLESQGVAVWCVDALDRALEYMAQLLPDVLVLDTRVTRDPSAFIEGMRANYDLVNVPVVLLEHDRERVDEEAAQALGARSVLGLPLHPDVLCRHVAAAAEQHARMGRAVRERSRKAIRAEWRRLELIAGTHDAPERQPSRLDQKRTPA